MGKTSSQSNLPANASLSYTLEHLRSFVTIEEGGLADSWQPLPDLKPLNLPLAGQKKFLAHFQRLKERWNISGNYIVRSFNNFPADCGLASSASSFAALTKAGWELAKRSSKPPDEDLASLSKLSRLGSGSSCRSFFSPWAVWRNEFAERADLNLQLEHAVVIVGAEKKTVSSSEAHLRVSTSLLFQGRDQRAEHRLIELLTALGSGDWKTSGELCWNEFWDMHALFETSRPSFGYMSPESLEVLGHLRKEWTESGDGPLVTMDAGANVHLLLRPDQTAKADVWLRGRDILKSWP